MNDEQKKWQQQFLNNSGGTREVFRLGCVFTIWLGTGIGLTLWSNNGGYILFCFGVFITFAFLSAIWQPAYSLLRKIFGNENLPRKIMPYKNTWWSYTLLIFWFVLSIAIVLKGIQLLFQ